MLIVRSNVLALSNSGLKSVKNILPYWKCLDSCLDGCPDICLDSYLDSHPDRCLECCLYSFLDSCLDSYLDSCLNSCLDRSLLHLQRAHICTTPVWPISRPRSPGEPSIDFRLLNESYLSRNDKDYRYEHLQLNHARPNCSLHEAWWGRNFQNVSSYISAFM